MFSKTGSTSYILPFSLFRLSIQRRKRQEDYTIGSTLLVAGTTIGAGMLALPMTGILIGPLPSIALLGGMWALMYYASLITIEINTYYKDALSINSIVEQLWGKKAYYAMAICFLGLFYPLIAAYLIGCVSLSQFFLLNLAGLQTTYPAITTLVTTLVFCLIIKEMSRADYYNRVFFLIKSIVFTGIIILLLPSLDIKQVVGIKGFNKIGLMVAIPIFFTSFGFHGSMPSIINYTSKDINKCRTAFFFGSLIALIFYILWVTVALGALPPSESNEFQRDVANFTNTLSLHSGISNLNMFTSVFSFLAITTSFIGVGVALLDFFRERFRIRGKLLCEIYSYIAAFSVPILLTIFYPEGFVKILSFASISAYIIAMLMPAAIAFHLRKHGKKINYRAPGGNIGLILIVFIGFAIVLIEVANLLKF